MCDRFRMLSELGAGEFSHINGTLMAHLRGTRQLLQQWGASAYLQDAGIFHAAYGTDGFEQQLVSLGQRSDIARIIGEAAEEIVYQYCACDRRAFFARIGRAPEPEFPNRFTGKSYCLPDSLLTSFWELTAANEIEIAMDNPRFVARYGAGLRDLFLRAAPYLSEPAREKVGEIFGEV